MLDVKARAAEPAVSLPTKTCLLQTQLLTFNIELLTSKPAGRRERQAGRPCSPPLRGPRKPHGFSLVTRRTLPETPRMSSPSASEHLARARRVFDLELSEARRVGERLDESFAQAVETIREVVGKRGKVVVVGVGKSGHIGEKIAATLTSTGAPAVMLNALNALHGDLGIV